MNEYKNQESSMYNFRIWLKGGIPLSLFPGALLARIPCATDHIQQSAAKTRL